MRIQKLGKQITLFMDEQHHHENVVVIMTNDGPVVIDAFGSAVQFAAVEAYLAEKGYQQPILQIFTHWHPDHVLGNQRLMGVRCLAQQKTWEALRVNYPERWNVRILSEGLKPGESPILEMFDEQWIGQVGGLDIHLLRAPGHTNDSTLVYIPEYKLVIAGDNLVGPEVEFFLPPVQGEDRALDLDALPSVYRQIREFSPKVIIPGHGWVLPPEEMLALNEHRFRNVLKRSGELVKRALQWLPGNSDFDEHLIRAWLGQASACATIGEQEALKVNVSKVLRQVNQCFEHHVLRVES